MRNLTNFVQAIYLPWTKDVEDFRPPLDVIADLEKYMNSNISMDTDSDEIAENGESGDCEEKQILPRKIGSFIYAHIRRTIGFGLRLPMQRTKLRK